jgi:hypothetical protein
LKRVDLPVLGMPSNATRFIYYRLKLIRRQMSANKYSWPLLI